MQITPTNATPEDNIIHHLIDNTEYLIDHPWNRSSTTFIAASDGSVNNGNGTFGWIISTNTGLRMLQNKGRAFGYPMTSFRAEAFGICSILIYLSTQSNATQGFFTTLQIVCDNEALVDTINQLLTQSRPEFPNDTLKPDWDVLQCIRNTHQQTPTVQIRWIKSHQDEDIHFKDLSLPAQLNCEADQLAREAHDLPFIEAPLRFPGNPIQVYHQSQVVTSHLKHRL